MNYLEAFRNSVIGKWVIITLWVFVSAAITAGLNAVLIFATENRASLGEMEFVVLTALINGLLKSLEKYSKEPEFKFFPHPEASK